MNQRSNKIGEDIKKGKEQVSKSGEDINELLTTIQGLSENVRSLSTHIESISKITQIIHNIVKEISFISLNAQIEARKIENSTTFSLLASEMRRLAESGKQSLKEANDIITNIITNINLNCEQISGFVDKVEELKKRTHKITDEFESVYQLVSSVLDYQAKLSEQIKQHFAGIQEMVSILENVYNEGIKIVENASLMEKQ